MADYTINNKWSVFADLQYRKVNYQINGFRKNPTIKHDLNWNFFNPKVKITYKQTNQQVSLMLGLAQKEPNRDDIEANVNELPKPEKMTNIELNYMYSYKNKLAFYVTSYLMYYKDQLVLTGKINDVGAYTRSNIPTSYRYGIEFETRWKPATKLIEINGNISFSQNKIQDFTEYLDDYDNGGQIENKYTKTDISFSPNIIAGLTTSLFPLRNSNYKKIQNTSIDLVGKYVGKQFLDNTSNSNRQLKAFETIDMIVNIPYQLNAKQTIGFRVGLYNLLNKKYEARGASYNWKANNEIVTLNYYFPQAGFHFMTGVVVNF
jgi:iron complex outermembrane receptor protein